MRVHSAETRATVVRLYSAGATTAQVALQLNLSRGQVTGIVSRAGAHRTTGRKPAAPRLNYSSYIDRPGHSWEDHTRRQLAWLYGSEDRFHAQMEDVKAWNSLGGKRTAA